MDKQSYTFPVNQLLTLDDPRELTGKEDFTKLGITSEHIPELIRLLSEEEPWLTESESPIVWAPLYAWRALGELKAVEAIDALADMMVRAHDYDDDWAPTELPGIFAQIGATAIPALQAIIQNTTLSPYVRGNAAEALVEIAQAHAAARGQCVEILTHQVQRLLAIDDKTFSEDDETLTSFLVGNLIDLDAIESLPVIEAAYAADRVDPSMHGDWEEVQIELGLKTERDTPAPHFFHLQQARLKAKQDKLALAERKHQLRIQHTQLATQYNQKKNKRKMAASSRKKNRKKK